MSPKIHLRVKKKLSAQGLHYSLCAGCSFRSMSRANTTPSVSPKTNKIKWIFTFSKERKCCLPVKNMPLCCVMLTAIVYLQKVFSLKHDQPKELS